MMMDWDSHINVEHSGSGHCVQYLLNISSKGQHKKKELKCIQSKSVILMMRINYSYMDRLCAQWGQCGIFMGIRTIQHLFRLFVLSKCKLQSNWIYCQIWQDFGFTSILQQTNQVRKLQVC